MTERPTNLRRNVVAGAVGNSLEWYDFAVYGYMAPILGRLFFPSEDEVASLLAAFGVFAVGYASRPIGGVIFGYLGDRFGRKPMLVVSILAMGTATCAIGVLPDHNQIGTLASLLLVVLRILQGLSVGGEFCGSIVFMSEHAPPERRGLDASWPESGAVIGFLLGSAVGALTATVLGQEIMQSWGWRVPFLLGSVIAVAGLIFRRNLTEPPAVKRLERGQGWPVVVALRDHWRPILRVMSLILVGAVGFYMMFVYAASYLTQHMHMSTARALDINTIALFFMLVLIAPLAMLSDRIGRKPLLLAASLGGLVIAWPLWWLIQQDSDLLILAGQMGFALIFALNFAVIPSLMAELLPAEVRCTGAAIGYNLCMAVFGGTTPFIATYLVARTADDFAPVYYFMAIALLQLIGLIGVKEMAGKPLP